ncbi:5-formyltetrahydrofolate cyclo-ligase [Jannaschia sp. W003]|uniref:5-formyltetrahydrofolate cyclo-ligase n=1 Tax=Jannaschia sp. W003 TaxID=2867012 RepID=UPI0021A2D663|nr:5-formyltetrahydrofolate cyclo-ligase [Jannaschia sp. W003]UWQ20633.1 5-formyltetrahydrofolate cyclo-ligase [Jannaschia sp. W003]
MGEGANLHEAKAQARAHCAAAREGVGPRQRAAAAVRLYAMLRELRGRTIAGYLPIGSEVSPLQCMRVLARDNTICVPVVTAKGAPLRFRQWWPGCPTETGTFGVPVPTEGGWRVPQILIVPLLGFDAGCNRLGYGGGFYDRTLPGLGDAPAFGLAVEAQRMVQVPREATDVRLTGVMTEAGLYRQGAVE